jgi:hypothetical protein
MLCFSLLLLCVFACVFSVGNPPSRQKGRRSRVTGNGSSEASGGGGGGGQAADRERERDRQRELEREVERERERQRELEMRSFREFSTKLPIVLRAPNARNAALAGGHPDELGADSGGGGGNHHSLQPLKYDSRGGPGPGGGPGALNVNAMARMAPLDRGGSHEAAAAAGKDASYAAGGFPSARQSSRQGARHHQLSQQQQQQPSPGQDLGPRLTTPVSSGAGAAAGMYMGGFGAPAAPAGGMGYMAAPAGGYLIGVQGTQAAAPGGGGVYHVVPSASPVQAAPYRPPHGMAGVAAMGSGYPMGSMPPLMNDGSGMPVSHLPHLQYVTHGSSAGIDPAVSGQQHLNTATAIAHLDGKPYVIPLVYSAGTGAVSWDRSDNSSSIDPYSSAGQQSASMKFPAGQAGAGVEEGGAAPAAVPPSTTRSGGPGGVGGYAAGAHSHHRIQVESTCRYCNCEAY